MSFLNSSTTNAFSIANANCVYWLVCTTCTPVPATDPILQLRSLEQLSNAASEFYLNGFHTFHVSADHLLWVFSLSDSRLEDQTANLDAAFNTNSWHYSLTKLSSGCLCAEDLKENTGQRFKANVAASSSSRTKFSSVVGTDESGSDGFTTSSFQSFNCEQIQDTFISALLNTVISRLSLSPLVTPLCYNAFAFDPEERYDKSGYDEQSMGGLPSWNIKGSHVRELVAYSVGLEWTCAGTIIVMYWAATTPLRSLTTTADPERPLHVKEVILAPLGLLRLPLDQEILITALDLTKRSDVRDQRTIMSLLQARNISLSRPKFWLEFVVRDASTKKELPTAGRTFIWPYELAFHCKSRTSTTTSTGLLRRPNINDALDFAHYVSLPGSMTAPHPVLPTTQTVSDDMDDPYALLLETITDRFDPSTVYPTPPDLRRTQNGSYKDGAAPTPATTISGITTALDDEDTGPQLLRDSSNNVEDDDLFGDLEFGLSDGTLNDDEFGFYSMDKTEVTKQGGTPVNAISEAEKPTDQYSSNMEELLRDEHSSPNVRRETEESPGNSSKLLDAVSKSGPGETLQTGNLTEEHKTALDSPKWDRLTATRIDDKYRHGGSFDVPQAFHPAGQNPGSEVGYGRAIPTLSSKLEQTNRSASDVSIDSESSNSDFEDDDDGANSDSDHMEGVETLSDSQMGFERSTRLNKVPLFELFRNRLPISTMNLTQQRDKYQYLSHALRVDETHYIELALLTEQQVCRWPLDGCLHDLSRHCGHIVPEIVQHHFGNVQDNAGANAIGGSSSWLSSTRITGKLRALLSSAVHESFENVQKIDLSTCARLDHNRQIDTGTPSKTSRFEIPTTESAVEFGTAIPLQVPEVVVLRGVERQVILASALPFWSELGISPVHNKPQSIMGYIFTPEGGVWTRGAGQFLRKLGEAFAFLGLGSHAAGTNTRSVEPDEPGLVLVDAGGGFEDYYRRLKRHIITFAQGLLETQLVETVAIYIVNTTDDVCAVPYLCSIYQRLQSLLGRRTYDVRQRLIFKILPKQMVLHELDFRFPPSRVLRNIAWEMYDRCLQATLPENDPVIHLARALPDTANISLSRDQHHRPIRRNLITHVAYSWVPGNPWLSMAFCDDAGKRRWHASYYVPWDRTKQVAKPLQAKFAGQSSVHIESAGMLHRFVNVAKEMLRSLLEITEEGTCPEEPVVHHVVLVKDGPITRHEELVWRSLSEKCSRPGGVAAILATYLNDTSGSPQTSGPSKGRTFGNVSISLTVAILDPDCPVCIEAGIFGKEAEHLRPYPTTTKGHVGLPGDAVRAAFEPAAAGTPRSAADEMRATVQHQGNRGPLKDERKKSKKRMVSRGDLAWFMQSKNVYAQTYTGKLELIPTPVTASPAGPATGLAAASTSAGDTMQGAVAQSSLSGGGYLILNSGHATVGIGPGISADSDETMPPPPPTVLSLRIVAAPKTATASPSPFKTVLQLAQAYRGLATIAVVSGLDGRLPWHVGTARRARIGLGKCM